MTTPDNESQDLAGDLGGLGGMSLSWKPADYPAYAPDQQGSWRPVLDEDGSHVGVVWSNGLGGTGVRWVIQTPAVTALWRHFKEHALAKTPGNAAYGLASRVPGAKLGDEQTGPLSGVDDELKAIDLEN